MASLCESVAEENSMASVCSSNDRTIDHAGLTKVTVSLLELMEKTGYRLEQINGQRRYGGPPPNWKGPPPPRGSEIFVGKIPRNCFEDELVPVFEKIGQIYELRLMMDFSGTTRGYAFVMYSSPEIADLAVKKLNGYEIREGRRIGVVKSVNNCRLFIGGLPIDKSEENIKCVLRRLTEGVMDLWLFKTGSKSRHANTGVQYAIVEYDSHRSAAMARRRLIPERVELWGREIIVDWATPHSRPKPTERDFHEELLRMSEEISVPSASVPQRTSLGVSRSNDSGIGTSSSRSSSNWSLEQAMDNALYGDSSILCCREQANNNSLVRTISAEIPTTTNTFNQLSGVALNREVAYDVRCRNGTLTRKNTGVKLYKSKLTGAHVDKKSKIYQQENFFHEDTLGSEENCDPNLGSQGMQNYSNGLYRPTENIYLNGAARTQILFSDYLDGSACAQNVQTPSCERPALSELTFDQLQTGNPGRFNKQTPCRPIRGTGIDMLASSATMPSYSGKPSWMEKQGLHLVGFVPVKPDENSIPFNNRMNENGVWENEKQSFVLGEYMPNVDRALSNNVAAKLHGYSWMGKQNVAMAQEQVPMLNTSSGVFVPINSIGGNNSSSSWNAKRDITSDSFSTENLECKHMELPFWASDKRMLVDGNIDDAIQKHDIIFNRAPGSPIYYAGKCNSVNQPKHIISDAFSFGNLF
ncbi:uncharacterized protein [Periplaneta americana]|uniref:uncharacterized protein isoform X1 n=1 Tax=Periplaneta americana TaxID=6978 RepID=UPI0037E7AD5C